MTQGFWRALLSTAVAISPAFTKLAHATGFLIIRTSEEIVAAADSREVNYLNDEPLSTPVCKIKQFGSGFAIADGLAQSPDGYAVDSILSEAGEVEGSLSTKIATFNR